MNLNERERRELDDIARHLQREDDRLAEMLSTMQASPDVSRGVRQVVAGIAAVLLLLVIAAAAAGQVPSSVGHEAPPTSNTSDRNGRIGDAAMGASGAGNRPGIYLGQPWSPADYAIQNDPGVKTR